MFFTHEQIIDILESNKLNHIERLLNGDDYDRGSLESIEASVAKLTKAICILLLILRDKETISIKELIDILYENTVEYKKD